MSDRLLVASGTNLMARGFRAVPTDRMSPDGAPVNALFAVARAIHRVVASRAPARAVAVIDEAPNDAAWPPILREQLATLPELLRALGFHVVVAPGEHHLVASYAEAARAAGDDAVVIGVDKRYRQLCGDGISFYDANKDVRYTPEIVEKRFQVPPARVGEWLALVGDDSGNDELPGVKGVGAKGAAGFIAEHGSVA